MTEADLDRKIAILIDADNVPGKYVKFIFDEISKHGTPTYRRIYGDWTNTAKGAWKNVLLEYSISPMQQFENTKGKNSTDSALIIDAMEIFYAGNVEGFCIVSSDSDFTKLAAILREKGMFVLGIGEKKTPEPFIKACQQFKFLEILAAAETMPADAELRSPMSSDQSAADKKLESDRKELTAQVKAILEEEAGPDGWSKMSAVANTIIKREPSFDSRNYKFKKFKDLVDGLGPFETRYDGKDAYARIKPKSKPRGKKPAHP
ncbi:MAG: NYN domain-containing protein [Candidatus Methanoplasma sp.]|nr:NYN domain-containing protein [Candidatus Methanoplasma sp.]